MLIGHILKVTHQGAALGASCDVCNCLVSTEDSLASVAAVQVKLLNVYIKRALEQQGPAGFTVSETSSPTSAVDNL